MTPVHVMSRQNPAVVPAAMSVGVQVGTGSRSFRVRSTSESSYSGRAGRCLDQPCSLACWAVSICSFALSRSTISMSRAVNSVVTIRPLKPCRTGRGRYPQWSR